MRAAEKHTERIENKHATLLLSHLQMQFPVVLHGLNIIQSVKISYRGPKGNNHSIPFNPAAAKREINIATYLKEYYEMFSSSHLNRLLS